MSPYQVVLRNRRLGVFLLGDFVSKLGDGMIIVALPLLALRIHGELRAAVAISLVLAAPALISLPLGLKVGLGRSRFHPRTVIVADSVLRFAVFVGLAVLAFRHALTLWVLFVALLLGSTLRTMAVAARRVLATGVVDDDERLTVNAVLGINDSAALYILGPALGGILVAAVDPWLPLLIDGLSFLVLVPAVLAMPGRRRAARSAGHVTRSGWQIMAATSGLWSLFFVTFAYNLLYGPVEVVLPLLVRTDLRAGDAAFGYLMTALGVGAVVGSFATGYLRRFRPERLLTVLIVGWGLALAVVATGPNLYVAGVGIALGGLIWAPFTPVMYTLVQRSLSRDDQQSVITFWSTGHSVAGPVGVLVGGVVAAVLTAREVLVLSALLTVALIVPALLAERGMRPPAKGRPVTPRPAQDSRRSSRRYRSASST